MTKHNLPYGKNKKIEIQLPKKQILKELKPEQTPAIKNFEKEFLNSLENTTDNTPTLKQKLDTNGNTVILVNDKTRSWNNQKQYIPILVNKLNEYGIPDEKISIIIGLGTHENQTKKENKNLLTEEIVDRIEIIQHEAKNQEQLIEMGKTSIGTKVELNKKAVKADNVIVTGGISIHHFAGYSGGRKSILPAISGYETIQQNHKLWLDPENQGFKQTTKGGHSTSDGNIISEDMEEAANLLNPEFLINILVNKDKEPTKIVSGNYLTAHKIGCNYLKKHESRKIKKKADLVIASAGGYPKDIQLYQATKAIFNSIEALKPGGTLIITAECREGIGNKEFYKFATKKKPFNEKMKELQKNFTIPKGVALYFNKCTEKYNIKLKSKIIKGKIEELGMEPIKKVEKSLNEFHIQETDDIYVIPYAVNVLPLTE